MEKRSFLYGFIIGSLVIFTIATIPLSESAIPPTRAFPFINVSVPWFTPDTIRVESQSSSDEWNIVSDGSMFFNITECFPMPC